MADYDALRARKRAYLRREFAADGRMLSLDEWQDYRRKVAAERPLSPQDKAKVVATAIDLLQGLYVHMDLKRARRGVDPIRQLRVLADRLDRNEPRDDHGFHTRMLEIFKSLGDVHTAYRPPDPYNGAIAFLPFLVNAYFDGPRRRFIVTQVLWDDNELGYQPFDRGVEIVTWNGTPMEEAVQRNTEFEEGSNAPHDFALALQFMTLRWLGASFEPDSPWVVVGYKVSDDPSEEIKTRQLFWTVFSMEDGPRLLVSAQAKAAIFGDFTPSLQPQRALHVASQIVHSWRKGLFVRVGEPAERKKLIDAGERLVDRFIGYVGRKELKEFTKDHAGVLTPARDKDIPSLLPLFFEARTHQGRELIERSGPAADLPADLREQIEQREFGYIGIRAFPLEDFEGEVFKYEFRRLLNLMPRGGLIVDVRDNPGGSARNAEESLQFLTANSITPLPFRFLVSDTTKRLAEADGPFGGYRASILTALVTGGAFSAGRPITPPALANTAGQHYFGPVVLLTSATTYSAGDIFAAGFQDNQLGSIIGVDETTGAGGANCWFYAEDISPALGLDPLAQGINLQMAVRQCARVGDENSGVPIEEVGIPVDTNKLLYRLTKTDILGPHPWGLLLRAAQEMMLRTEAKQSCDLETELRLGNAGGLALLVRTHGITRLDLYEDDRPTTRDVNDAGETLFELNERGDGTNNRTTLELCGFADDGGGVSRLVARYVQAFDRDVELSRLRQSTPPPGVTNTPALRRRVQPRDSGTTARRSAHPARASADLVRMRR